MNLKEYFDTNHGTGVLATAETSPLICAGDHFQCISGHMDSPALQWASEELTTENLLNESKRTENIRIIHSALRLRGDTVEGTKRVAVQYVPTGAYAGAVIMKNFRGSWRYGSSAIIAHSFDRFVKETIDWLKKGKTNDPKKQPVYIHQFIKEDEEMSSIIEMAPEIFSETDISIHKKLSHSHPVLKKAWENMVLRARRNGRSGVAVSELRHEISNIVHVRRSYGYSSPKFIALPVHSAKNQEWDNVYVLWSDRHFRKEHNSEYRRRILYNAITRSKKHCLILYNGKKELSDSDILRLI